MNTRPSLRGGNFRLNFLLWLLPLCCFFAGAAAQTYSRTAYRLTFFGCNATYATATATNPTSITCQAVFKRNYSNTGDATDVEESGPGLSTSFDLLAAPATTTTVATGGGVTVTDAQLAALIRKRSEAAGGL